MGSVALAFFVYVPTNSCMGYGETVQLYSSGQGFLSKVDSTQTSPVITEQNIFDLLWYLQIELPG